MMEIAPEGELNPETGPKRSNGLRRSLGSVFDQMPHSITQYLLVDVHRGELNLASEPLPMIGPL